MFQCLITNFICYFTYNQTSTNSVTVDNISTSNLDYSFTFATPRTITAGDVIALVWKTDTSSSASNYVGLHDAHAMQISQRQVLKQYLNLNKYDRNL